MDASAEAARAKRRAGADDASNEYKELLKWFDQATFTNSKMSHEQLCSDVVTLGSRTRAVILELAKQVENSNLLKKKLMIF